MLNQFMQLMKSGQNPQQLVLSILEQKYANTPMGANLISLAKANRGEEIEAIVRNYSKQRGIDFDKEFAAFCQMLGVKK